VADAGATFDTSVLDTMAGHLTRVVQVRLFQLYYERLRRLRVSPGAFAVLTAIRSNPGVQHGALADALAAHGPNMTKLVDRLVRAGWVERRRLAGDKRATGHYLTASGRAKAESILKAGLAHDELATSALSVVERTTLLRLLARLDRELAARSRRRSAS
jgi:DNA-binding MarR family transcriptional regulator